MAIWTRKPGYFINEFGLDDTYATTTSRNLLTVKLNGETDFNLLTVEGYAVDPAKIAGYISYLISLGYNEDLLLENHLAALQTTKNVYLIRSRKTMKWHLVVGDDVREFEAELQSIRLEFAKDLATAVKDGISFRAAITKWGGSTTPVTSVAMANIYCGLTLYSKYYPGTLQGGNIPNYILGPAIAGLKYGDTYNSSNAYSYSNFTIYKSESCPVGAFEKAYDDGWVETLRAALKAKGTSVSIVVGYPNYASSYALRLSTSTYFSDMRATLANLFSVSTTQVSSKPDFADAFQVTGYRQAMSTLNYVNSVTFGLGEHISIGRQLGGTTLGDVITNATLDATDRKTSIYLSRLLALNPTGEGVADLESVVASKPNAEIIDYKAEYPIVSMGGFSSSILYGKARDADYDLMSEQFAVVAGVVKTFRDVDNKARAMFKEQRYTIVNVLGLMEASDLRNIISRSWQVSWGGTLAGTNATDTMTMSLTGEEAQLLFYRLKALGISIAYVDVTEEEIFNTYFLQTKSEFASSLTNYSTVVNTDENDFNLLAILPEGVIRGQGEDRHIRARMVYALLQANALQKTVTAGVLTAGSVEYWINLAET